MHNPLTDNPEQKLKGDFTWQVARSIIQDDPAYIDPYIKSMKMRNDSHPTVKHVTQTITIPSGKTMWLPGDVAQVVVEHLVDEIMYRQGHKTTVGDPVLRRETEELVIMNIDDLRSQLTSLNIEEQLEQQIRDMNKDDSAERTQDAQEPTFPGLKPGGQEDRGLSEPTPTPGTGVSFTPSQEAVVTK